MKRFLFGLLGLVVLELANVYFIMPMPGSQRMRSVDAAHWLYQWRWAFRIGLGLITASGALVVWRLPGWRKWLVPVGVLAGGAVAYVVNFRMAADQMFRQPTTLVMLPAELNAVAEDRLVVGIEVNGEARAYPLQFIGYHHQVRDTVGGRDVLVSYCTVCRTGRVFAPVVDGRPETFRLVGMDHFNAMFEDRTTGSWWRQANGEAIVGPRQGAILAEIPSLQVTVKAWLALHPRSLIMQADPAFLAEYGKDYSYERGTSRSVLTGTDTTSWGDKSWVVGLTVNGRSRAYDWNQLRRERIIEDELGGSPVVVVLSADDASFFAFERPSAETRFVVRGDSLVAPGAVYALNGRGATGALKPVSASQEFWHSWRTFQPTTDRH